LKRAIILPTVLMLICVTAGAWAQSSPSDFSQNDGPVVARDWAPLPGSKVLRDLRYGADPKQRYDVYLPADPKAAPLFVMVHGGGWRTGDKAMGRVVENKAKHWLAQGFIFVSVNNRLLPDADPLQQSEDIAHALAAIQHMAERLGSDPTALILAGHSAGAHLVDLLAADPSRAYALGARPWKGTLSLDSGAIDTVKLMQNWHARLFDKAFGDDEAFWHQTSPLDRLTAKATPFMLVCSSQRRTSCPANHDFALRAKSLGVDATVLEEDLSHGEINETLGLPGAYTENVDGFIKAALSRPN
jgi:arylformamidase